MSVPPLVNVCFVSPLSSNAFSPVSSRDVLDVRLLRLTKLWMTWPKNLKGSPNLDPMFLPSHPKGRRNSVRITMIPSRSRLPWLWRWDLGMGPLEISPRWRTRTASSSGHFLRSKLTVMHFWKVMHPPPPRVSSGCLLSRPGPTMRSHVSLRSRSCRVTSDRPLLLPSVQSS